ncbi:MAG: dihydroneopterin aldolase [Bacteroidota bacterium]
MSIISIEGMEFFAYHGCFDEEQLIGTRFVVDASMEVNVEEACVSDNLHKTIDYQKVYALIKVEMEIKSHLLENVCWRIISSIKKQFPEIIQLHVKVSKMSPPIGGKVNNVSFSAQM